jgi:hypothetical protein
MIIRAVGILDKENKFTKVLSWGGGKNGQLSLGLRLMQGKQIDPCSRFYSYNIPLKTISWELGHSVFITGK